MPRANGRARLAPMVLVTGGLLVCGRLLAARNEPSREPEVALCQDADTAAPSAALNCMTLVPSPDFPQARGTIQLQPVPSPFGVTVHADGTPRQRLIATFSGLRTARSLGSDTVFVAWASTLSLDSVVKLGVVRNGRLDLGEMSLPQFRVLVSAERSAEVRERTGRLVLRGTSPSARLMAHRDVVQPSAPGALRDDASPPVGHMPAMHDAPNAADAWRMPPLPAGSAASGMMGMANLVPGVSPFVVAPRDSADILASRPREVVHLENGDTLRLESGLVRRTLRGKSVIMYGFNGQHPGPLIDVRKGATVVVQFHNGIDQPSAVHWHGVRLDNRFDGVPGVTQDAVAPGATFTYVVRFPDSGIYWYHPHVREDIQQDLGLYGNIMVRSTSPGYLAPVNREQVLMLDDLLMDGDGLTPWGATSPTHALMGRFGNVMLVNGEPRYDLEVKRGEIVRFYFTNASNARLFNLSFPGARMKVVASDVGKFEREEWVSSVVIAPAERYVVDVEFSRPGRTALVNRIQALDHMFGTFSPEADTLGAVRVRDVPATPRYGAEFARLRRNGDVAAELAPYRSSFDAAPTHSLVLTMRTRGLPAAVSNMLIGINAPVEWNDGMAMMNWVATGDEVSWVLRDPATGKENMAIDWHFRVGQVAKIRVFNDPSSSHAMDHPLHLHGQRFLVVSRDGVPATNLVWKDTAIVPTGETVDLLVDMANPGRWMIHCHIAEHLGAGMMGVFTVDP
ncbi:MAG TPA: multicopper oxidase family protein [Gemmatimonadaceae bacterium]|nr:multicopper oxidase family protein [Gemmatimonadaceae bacterium]